MLDMGIYDKVRGLCGTLTWNQRDDFTTPEGDVENSVTSFVAKFTTELCTLPGGATPEACSTYTQRRQYAETVCAVIHSPIFQVSVMGTSVVSYEFVAFVFIHTCTSISDSTVVSRRGGEGAIFPSLSVRGLQLCAAGSLSLHRPHCLCPTLCSGRCCGPVAQPHLLQ